MIDLLQEAILHRWGELGRGGPAPRRLAFHVSGDGAGRHGRAIARVFVPPEPDPILLVKIPRDGAARQLAVREHHLLREMEEIVPALAGRRFPRALLLEVCDGRLVTVQSLAQGTPLDRRIRETGGDPAVAPALFGEARRWLTELWRDGGLLEGSEAALWEPLLRSAHFYLQTWDPAGEERVETERIVRDIEERHGGIALHGFGHGEFSPGNLLTGAGAATAVDWEFGEKRQLPWMDAVSFAVDLSMRVGEARHRDRVAGFETAFRRPGLLHDATREFLAACFAEGGVPQELLSLALPAFALSRAHRAARYRAPDHPHALEWRSVARTCVLSRARIEEAFAVA